jgi:cytidylate kinase
MTLQQFSKFAEDNSQIARAIDDRTRLEAKSGNVVIDAQLAAWVVKEADVKLLLVAPDEVRYRRIAERDGIPLAKAKTETITREMIQKERYKRYYNIDEDDLRIYDLKIDTSANSVEETSTQIVEAVRTLLAGHKAA